MIDPKVQAAPTGVAVATPVAEEVRGLVDVVKGAPEVPADKRTAVQSLARDLLRQEECTAGLDLNAFLAAGISLSAACDRPATPARTCDADKSEWFEQVGIRGRERRDEELENRHFEGVSRVGTSIEECCAAIREVVATAETAVCGILGPVKRTLELVMNFGFKQLVEPAVELAIEALSRARETAVDRNCVIADCFDAIARCVDEAAQHRPAPPVEFAARTTPAGTVRTQAASAGEANLPGLQVSFDFGVDASINAKLDAKVDARVDLGGFETGAMIGAFGALGAAAALGALECLAASVECPTPEPAPEPAPQPEPPAPAPEPPPAPAPPAAPTPTGDGVIAPPPELAQVEEPAPPPKKIAAMQPASVEPVEPEVQVQDTPTERDPWAVKKTGEW